MSARKNSRSANGGGTIRQRPNGRWEARYTLGRNPSTGKQVQKSIYGATQKEVRQKLAAITHDIDDGTYTPTVKMSVTQWLDIWLTEYSANLAPATLVSYEGWVRTRIKPAIGALKLEALKPHDIQAFYNSLQTGDNELSTKSISNIHGILHKALQQALELNYIKSNPTNPCKLPNVIKPQIHPMDGEQVGAFLKAIQGHEFELFFIVDLFTGMRQGELLGLTWDCVNFEQGTIFLYRQLQLLKGIYSFRPLKDKGARLIAPSRNAIDALREQFDRQTQWKQDAGTAWNNDEQIIFTNEIGRHLSRSTTYHKFKDIVASLGIPERRFHDIRHSFAVMSLQAGDDVKSLQSNMGHYSAAFTLDTYGHVTEGMKQTGAARMDAYAEKLKQ
jgi:integrase